MRKELEDNADSLKLQVIWDFEGYLKYSPIFYGYYSKTEKTAEGLCYLVNCMILFRIYRIFLIQNLLIIFSIFVQVIDCLWLTFWHCFASTCLASLLFSESKLSNSLLFLLTCYLCIIDYCLFLLFPHFACLHLHFTQNGPECPDESCRLERWWIDFLLENFHR